MEIFVLTVGMFAWLAYVQTRAIIREKLFRKVIVALPSLVMTWVIADLALNESNLWPFAIFLWTAIACLAHVIIVSGLTPKEKGNAFRGE